MMIRAAGVRRALTIVGNEMAKGLRLAWSERVQIVIELPLFVSFVLLLGYTVGHGDEIVTTGRIDWHMDSAGASWLLIGMSAHTFVYLLVQKVFWRLIAEIQTGTFEQTYLSPVHPWLHIALGRPLASVAEAAIVVAALVVVINLFVPIELHWRPDALVPLLALITGAVGLSLIVAGLALVWKRVEMLTDLTLLSIMFFSGVAMRLDVMPSWTRPVSESVFMTHAIAGLRRLLLDDHALAASGVGGLAWLVVTSVGWLVAGVVLFRICEGVVKQRGTLSRY